MNRAFLATCVTVCVFGLTCGAFAQASLAQGATASQPTVDAPQAPSSSVTVPRLIKFSGVLKDTAGRSKTGMAAVTFAIYGEQEGGTALWMETQNVTLEEGGKYTALLGANSDGGVPTELFGGGREEEAGPSAALGMTTERWLGVEGAEIQAAARVLLVSVPYALRAADAEKLGGLPASAFVLANPQTREKAGPSTSLGMTTGAGPSPATMQPVGMTSAQAGFPVPLKPAVGTATGPGSSPATTLNATLTTVKPKAATTAATATVDNDFVAKFDSTGSLVPSAIFEGNGNVGIGTTNPLAPLHVNGNTLLVTSATTAQTLVSGAATSGRFGQDAGGAFMASDTKGSSVRFLTSNGNLNEWMRIGSTGSVNIGSAQAAKFGEAVFAPDNVDTVHSVIGQAGSQYHFRLSRAIPDNRGARHLLITPYLYGTAIEYPGVVEFWNQEFSVHAHPSIPSRGAFFWVGDEIDSGGLFVTAMDNGGGINSNVILAADRFTHTSHGSLNFVVRNTTDTFRFDVGAFGSEVMAGQISGTASASNMDLFNGPVQATLRAANGSTVDAEIGATSNHPLSLFANNGAARVTLFPSGNFSIGNNTDTAALAVGTTAQFQVTAAGAVTIGGGTPITQQVSTTASLAFAGFASQSCNTLSVAVNGAAEGDTVALGMPNAVGSLDGVTWFGWVSGPGVVSIRGCNATVNTVPAPPAANIRVDVWKH